MDNFEEMIECTYKIPEEIEETENLLKKIKFPKLKFNNYFFTGTGGGSRASIDLLNSYLIDKIKRPYYAHQDYFLPGFVGKNTLSVVVSYSGNTEESLYAIKELLERESKMITISSGGELEKIAKEKGIFHVLLPEGFEARSALPFIFFTLLKVEEFYENLELSEDVLSTVRLLKDERDSIMLSGRQIAETIKGAFPLFYGTYGFSDCLAERFRRQIAENGKTLSHSNVIPNMHHDEIVGYMNNNLKNFVIPVFIRDSSENPKIKKRFVVTKEILEEKGFKTIEIYPKEHSSKLARMFYLLMLIDFASIFHGSATGFDPKDVSIIKELKERMKDE